MQSLEQLPVGLFPLGISRRDAFAENRDEHFAPFLRQPGHRAAATKNLIVGMGGNDKNAFFFHIFGMDLLAWE
jgi:hypothetical protein